MRVGSTKRTWRTRGYRAAAAAAAAAVAAVRDMPVVKARKKKAVERQKKATTDCVLRQIRQTATTVARKQKSKARRRWQRRRWDRRQDQK